ncbi:MAG: hypothetical protein QF718_09735 [Phycisphaerales bacterium]|jgi:hypothetical protein|nr:hypothetical protein [Phycisphaerales bacterium]
MSNNKLNKPHGKKIGLVVVTTSSLLSLLLLLMLFYFSEDEAVQPKRIVSDEIKNLLITSQDNSAGVVDITSSDLGVELPLGGWVQQTDSMGKLVQQYRCAALNPDPPGLPDGWIEMKKPEVEMFLSDNRLVRIKGDTGIANAPKRSLESGEIAGHVVVSMFDLSKTTDTITQEPSITLTTPQISFDNFIGEITCDGEVNVVSPSQKLVGRRLAVRFNETEERIEYLRLDELDYIEINPNSTNSPTQPTMTSSTYRQPKTNSNHKIHAAAAGPDIDYYIVTLIDNVTILQGDQHTGRMGWGNKLTIAFSNDSDSSVNLNRKPTIDQTPSQIYSIPAVIAGTTLTSTQPSSQPPVKITCDGGLLMVPLEDETLMPSTSQDTRIELFGSKDNPVRAVDNIHGFSSTGELLRYEVQQDRSDLFGDPAILLMDETVTTANHLWIARQDGEGGVIGRGTMTDASIQPATTTLEWEDHVDFSFETGENGDQGALSEVVCHGSVELNDQGSRVECSRLNVIFDQDSDGSSIPTLAVATGDVKATSDTQVLWADQANVSFVKESENVPTEENSMFGGSKADTMSATGNVQVLLSDGGRAFCEQLNGHISQDVASMSGDVVIAYKRMLMNRGEKATLTLDRDSGKGKWDGSGQAIFLETPLNVSPNHRIERPTIQPNEADESGTNKITMRANWNKSMEIDQKFNENAGAIDLSGDVDIRSQQSKFERGQMTGDDLRLEFMNVPSEITNNDSQRELRKVIAKNNAQIEHRLWSQSSPETPPVVYYIGGNHVEFDSITREALAVGIGELVLRDMREPKKGTHQSALAGRGTTRFTWDEKLNTTRLSGNLYRVEMNGNVEMLHQGLDSSIGRLTSDKIEAIAVDPNPENGNTDNASRLTLRGMDLQQLNAFGSVYVATETRRVDCDVFDYNLRTGFAKLEAVSNRSVSIVTQGTPYPVRASSIVWNMDPDIDTINIKGLQGTSPTN